MRDLSIYLNESRRLKDLKGKRVGKIEVDGNLVWKKTGNSWATINDIDGLEEKDMDEMYKVYEKEGVLYVGFEYGGHEWYMEFRNAPGHRIAVYMYKDDVHVNRVAFFNGQENFRDFWYHTLPKALKVY